MTSEEDDEDHHPGRASRFIEWLGTTESKVYASRALTSWGDRMWQFAIGLYMIKLEGTSLRLAAIFGFLSSLSVIICGGPIGNWVDATKRLKAAKFSLVSQNISVAVCSIILSLTFTYKDVLMETANGWPMILCETVVISLAICSKLASLASGLIIDKDWIIEIAERNPKKLAGMNAMLRRIDLTSLVIAPAVVGQIMTYTSSIIAAIFLALWNIVSVFVEFYLLWNIYHNTPGLKNNTKDSKKNEVENSVGIQNSAFDNETSFNNESNGDTGKIDATELDAVKPSKTECTTKSKIGKFKSQLKQFLCAWKLYFNQDVKFAGLSLAMLYMTVLGFDSITIGYAYIQGISESLMGWMSAVSGIFGIVGTLLYPYLHKRFQLDKTGLFGLVFFVSSLSLCVISIWVPGSPFIYSGFSDVNSANVIVNKNETTTQSPLKLTRYDSIITFLSGIIIARFGLWIADLTITQIYQESVFENERGKVNGVQKSLEEGMNMLKSIGVIVLPKVETFGILIILSFVFIFFGLVLFSIHARKVWFSCCSTQENKERNEKSYVNEAADVA